MIGRVRCKLCGQTIVDNFAQMVRDINTHPTRAYSIPGVNYWVNLHYWFHHSLLGAIARAQAEHTDANPL